MAGGAARSACCGGCRAAGQHSSMRRACRALPGGLLLPWPVRAAGSLITVAGP